MLETFGQVRTILDGQSDQVSLEAWILFLQNLKLDQVGLEVLCTTADSAQRAKEVFFAETGTVKAYTVDREVMTKYEVITTRFYLVGHGLILWQRFHIIDDIESTFFCLAVPIDSFWQRFDTF